MIALATLQQWGRELGFQRLGVSNTDLSAAELQLHQWLSKGYHGSMSWMMSHGSKRSNPAQLIPDTLSIISVRMDYLPPDGADPEMVLNHPELAYVSRYALGRDYHKVMRKRLQQLATKIENEVGQFGYRVFVDSAPVLEKPIAAKAGLGWIGKHSNLLSREAGSWFFLGEIYTDLVLTETEAVEPHCGDCTACMDICPTNAIVEPYEVDARRCISYLTIESDQSIPVEFRRKLGNRIYGCDDCQLVCPWNRFARLSEESDYTIRHGLDDRHLLDLFIWSEKEFLERMQGSAIRRIGYQRWQRNIAVALGNAPYRQNILTTLEQRRASAGDMVREHIDWAIGEQRSKHDQLRSA